MFTSNSVPTLLPALKKVPPFDPATDFVPVCTIAKAPMNVFIRSSLPFKSLAEFVAAAKSHPDEHTFAYSTGLNRLGAEWFQQLTGIKLRGIAYKATAQALIDVVGGEVDLIVADASTAYAPYQAGKMRPLVVADTQRSTSVPDAPAATEVGLQGFNVSVWFGVYLPARTPKEIVVKWQQLIKVAAASTGLRDANQLGGRDEMVLCGDNLNRYQQAEITRWKNLVSQARIELE
jgi:tripartite-type tricarboxylate transporter receptor subunit TctC